MKPYLTYIEGDSKGRSRVDFTSRCTFIRGPHGKGKSRVIDNLWLGLQHEHPAFGKESSEILLLAPGHQAPFRVEIGISTGDVCKFEILEGTTSSAKKSVATRPDWAGNAIVHTDVLTFLDGSKTEMRRQIMRRFGEDVRQGMLDIPEGSTEAEQEYWRELVGRTKPSDPPEERLGVMLTLVRSDKLKCGKEIKAAEKELSGPAPAPVNEEELARLRAARGAVAGLITAWDQQRERLLLEQQIAEYVDIEGRIERVSTALTTRERNLAQTEALLLILGEGPHSKCPLCHVGPGSIAEELRGQMREMVGAYRADVESVRHELHGLEGLQAHRGVLRSRLEAIPAPPGSPRDRCQEQLQKLDEKIVDASQHTVRFKTYNGALVDKEKKERHREVIKRVEHYVLQRIESRVGKVAGRLATKLTAHLPAGRQAGVVLHDEHRDVCRVGYIIDGRVFPAAALGGREVGDLVVAVAGAFGEGRPLSVLVLDDLLLGHFRERGALAGLYKCCVGLVEREMVSNVVGLGTAEAWVDTAGWQVVDVE